MAPRFEPTRRIPLIGAAVVAAFLVSSCERAEGPPSSPAKEVSGSSGLAAIDDADLASILKIDEPLVRVERVAAYLQRARTDQLGDIKHTFEHALLDRGDLEYALMIEWWARFDPKAAYEYTVSGELRGEHARLRATAVRAWARQDPQDALKTGYLYDIKNLDGSLDPEMLDALMVGWWDSGKPGLTDFVNGLKLASDRTRATRTYARRLISRDGPRETLKEISDLKEFPEDVRRLILAGALTIIAHEDPALAVEWLPIAEAQGIDTRTFAMRIVGGWAHHDPLAATEWANQLPAGDERDRALQRAAQDWQAKDPEAFLAWLDRQKVNPELDFMRYLAIRTSAYADPNDVDWPSLIERSKTIGSDVQRQASTLWCLQVWHHLNADAASAWLDAHSDVLPPDQRARVAELNAGDRARIDRAIADKKRAETTEPIVVPPL